MQNDETQITHDVNSDSLGNNTFELHASGLCGRLECLQIQVGPDSKLVEIPRCLETIVPMCQPAWSAATVGQRVSEATRVFRRVVSGIIGSPSVDCVHLRWMLLLDKVERALAELTAGLRPNTAQQFYCTMAHLYINHYAYADSPCVRAMYDFCRKRRQQLLDLDNQNRAAKIAGAKEGELSPKLRNAFAALGGKQSDGTPNLDFLYGMQTTPMGRILHKLLLVCRRNETRFLKVYFKVNGELHDAVTAAVVDVPSLNNIIIEGTVDSTAIATFGLYKTCKDKKTGELKPAETVELPADLVQLIREEMESRQQRLSFMEDVSNLLCVDTKGGRMDGQNQSDKFGKMVNRHFRAIKGSFEEGEKPSDRNISTTEIRKYFASLKAKEVWAAQETINEAVAPFSHSGAADLGVHTEYMHVIPDADMA